MKTIFSVNLFSEKGAESAADFVWFFAFIGVVSAWIEVFYVFFGIYAGGSERNSLYECDFSHTIAQIPRYRPAPMWFFTQNY
ncbi:hypothetical protein [Cohnella fermenti]|uniref:Uncharacterized protein n=1 Tax=Cohnella fermenti TaxID=2565925 RepID=A0A4S4BLP5_9BACL|nr:hypothetical protein [Cohnella fermenti]THF73261.1 hypothetical protein E6C55_30005 [Cohnella fermenti]